jgi:hypothetical protein
LCSSRRSSSDTPAAIRRRVLRATSMFTVCWWVRNECCQKGPGLSAAEQVQNRHKCNTTSGRGGVDNKRGWCKPCFAPAQQAASPCRNAAKTLHGGSQAHQTYLPIPRTMVVDSTASGDTYGSCKQTPGQQQAGSVPLVLGTHTHPPTHH